MNKHYTSPVLRPPPGMDLIRQSESLPHTGFFSFTLPYAINMIIYADVLFAGVQCSAKRPREILVSPQQ